jgi:tetratricopeptide (TPR) repeat protein
MRLKTLGSLQLEGTNLTQQRPLLLLAYLSIEGVKPRHHLADKFFMGNKDRPNSLSRVLSDIRKAAEPGTIKADNKRVWAVIDCDSNDLIKAANAHNLEGCLNLYQGAFAEDLDIEIGTELEEWVLNTQIYLADKVRELLLRAGEQKAQSGNFTEAASYAEKAFTLAGASEVEPEHLHRYFALLESDNNPYAAKVRQEAEEYGIQLMATPEKSRAQLNSVFIGRNREFKRLNQLSPGHWAWVRGGVGIGKTSLLQQVQGQYIPGRTGLPFATLEPLVSDVINDGAEAILRRLLKQEKTLCIDDWENIDAESQDILKRLRTLKPNLKVIVSAASAPPFAVDVLLELSPLPKEALEATTDLWQKTGGVPKLVSAHLQGESLAEALEATLSALPEHTRRVYLSLSLLDEPNPSLVRRALGLSAVEMVEAIEGLLSAGLAAPSGRVWPRQVAKEYLNDHPTLLGQLALRLAKMLEGTEAFMLYQASKTLWADDDLEAIQNTYIAWANEVLKRGFPKRAVEILEEAPSLPSAQLLILKAQALEHVGDYQAAFQTLEGLEETSEVLALKGKLHWRLGRSDLAKTCARSAMNGEIEERAEALNTLGAISLTEGKYKDAEGYFRSVAPLWQMLGYQEKWVRSLNNLVMALLELKKDFSSPLQQALDASRDYPSVRSLVLLTYGHTLIEHNKPTDAERVLKEAIVASKAAGSLANESLAWNNLGVIYHKERRTKEAIEAYSKALSAAQQTGDKSDIGLVLANIAELQDDPIGLEESLLFLEKLGHGVQAQQIRGSLLSTNTTQQLDTRSLQPVGAQEIISRHKKGIS